MPDAAAISIQDRGKDELDVLFTAGGDRLWKLILNLATGGRHYGLNQFDYFENRYFADVPYRIPAGGLDVWLRLRPEPAENVGADGPNNPETREQALSEAASRGAVFLIEAQSKADSGAPFVPFAKIRFDREIEIDQEALHFQPTTGRGFQPYGILTSLREKVYPVSAHARPASRADREARDRKGFFFRLFHRAQEASAGEEQWTNRARAIARRWLATIGLVVIAAALVSGGLWRLAFPSELSDDESAR